MALEIRDAIGSLTETWRRLGHEIGFGIGIAHGFATLGTNGFEGRFDYAAIGTVSNVASRLCDEATNPYKPESVDEGGECREGRASRRVRVEGDQTALAAYNVVGAVSPPYE
jgi:hypothetical protein